ncbi:discoidin domain-containing protein [Paenibacillus nasutitermitis]|uniref:F5/8 type C domain-containing protein n=1 Tax=Paenibacillus nasutitermitis TaxID=1652958 RepID=A0A917E1A7_9BACL|nr:discoidin domain-containing protein [Paenibacillus nasutitermitis]GGD88954.1 hypothetical protein GCM10010911_54440 [Paenibacillus nasutitermitis]
MGLKYGRTFYVYGVICAGLVAWLTLSGTASAATVTNDTANKKVTMAGTRYSATLDYNGKAVVSSFKIDNKELLEQGEGIFSAVRKNLALGKSVTSSSSLETAAWGAAKATDGKIASGPLGWSSNSNVNANHTEWVSVDLGAVYSVARIDLHPRYDSSKGFPADFTIELSDNGSTWSTVVSRTAYPQPEGSSKQSFSFAAANARYIKVTGTSLRADPNESNAYRMQLAEIEAYQTDGGWNTSKALSVNPSVTVSGNVVTASFATAVASETWTFTVSDANLQYKLSRTYGSAYTAQEQGTPTLVFKQDAVQSIRWPASGAQWWVGGEASAQKWSLAGGTGYSAENNVRKSSEDTSFVLLSTQADNWALKVDGTTNRSGLARGAATEVDRLDAGSTKPLSMNLVASSTGSGLLYASGPQSPKPDGWGYYTGQVRHTGNRIFGDVNAAANENVQTTLTFTPDSFDSYYDLGTLNGMNEYQLSQALNDYGRMGIMGRNHGVTIEGPTYFYENPPLEQHWNVNSIGLLGDSNALVTMKNGLNNIRDWVQDVNGHVISPFPWEDQSKDLWGKVYHDMQFGYVIAISNLYALNGDTNWLNGMKLSGEKALDFAIANYVDPTTYVVKNHSPTNPGLMLGYNDYWEKSVGTYNAYMSAMFYESLVKWAELERNVLADTAKAQTYENIAATLKTNMNRNLGDGTGLWSPATKSFAYGSDSGDVRYVPSNAAALRAGVMSKDRMKQVVESVERDQQNFDLGFHVTTVRDLRNAWAPAPQGDDYAGLFIGENGGWYGAVDGDFYAGYPAYGDRNKIPYYINRFLSYFQQTHFFGSSWKRDGVTRADLVGGDSFNGFPSHIMPIWGLYTYGYGFQPQYNRLVLAPFINDSMAGSVVKYKWRGQHMQVTYTTKYKFSVQASALPTNIAVRFINQTPNAVYTVKVDGVNQSAAADADGNVEAIMSTAGTHSFELVNPDAAVIPSATSNIAMGKPTAASSVNGGDSQTDYWPEVATDGDAASSNHWVTSGSVFPAWLRVDFGNAYPLKRVVMTFDVADTYKYRIEGTNSLVDPVWTTLIDRTASGVTGSSTAPVTETVTGTYQYLRVYFTGTIGGNWANLRELEVYPDTSPGINLALNKPVETSSSLTGNWDRTKAVDGLRNSGPLSGGWSSDNGAENRTEYLTVDLRTVHNIGAVQLFPRNDAGNLGESFPVDFTISVSVDGNSWSTVVSKTGYPKPLGGQHFSFAAVNARYVKLTSTRQRYHAAENNYLSQIAELEVYAAPQLLSQSKTATSSTNNNASNAVDGNDNTYWWASDASMPQWFKVDLGANYTLLGALTKFYANENWKYKIEGSTDNSTWTTLLDYTPGGVDSQDVNDALGGSYRYVKVTITGSGGDWASIREFKVYGY